MPNRRDWATCVVVARLFNMNKNKVAIWIEGGLIQGIRSSVDIDVEIIDVDLEGVDRDTAEQKWEQYQTELPFNTY